MLTMNSDFWYTEPEENCSKPCEGCSRPVNAKRIDKLYSPLLYVGNPTPIAREKNGVKEYWHTDCCPCDRCGEKIHTADGAYTKPPGPRMYILHRTCNKCDECGDALIPDMTFASFFGVIFSHVSSKITASGKLKLVHTSCEPCVVCNVGREDVRVNARKTKCSLFLIEPATSQNLNAAVKLSTTVSPSIPPHILKNSRIFSMHDTCKPCRVCKQPLGSEAVLERENGLIQVHSHAACMTCTRCELATSADNCNRVGMLAYHFECVECTICHKRLPFKPNQRRKVFPCNNALCHSDCITCGLCDTAAKGRHVKAWYDFFDTTGRVHAMYHHTTCPGKESAAKKRKRIDAGLANLRGESSTGGAPKKTKK